MPDFYIFFLKFLDQDFSLIMDESLYVPFLVVLSVVLGGVVLILVLQNKNFGKQTPTSTSSQSLDISSGLKREEKATEVVASNESIDDRVLNPAVFKTFKILKIMKASYNTKLIRFEIPHGKSLGLPIGRHISIKAEVDGNHVIRAYTPTSRPDQTGYFDLLIKNYDLGKLSPHLHSLKVGSSVGIRGPVGRFKYEKNTHKKIGLIAGGSGLTPCLQLIRCLLEGPDMVDDSTSLVLLFQNRTEDDILLKKDLDELQKTHPHRLKVVYYLSNPQTSEFGQGHTSHSEKRGYINQEDTHALLHPSHCQLVCICGPSGFNNSVKKLLVDAGHDENKSIYVW
jgi:cytochrome-b5 reductase